MIACDCTRVTECLHFQPVPSTAVSEGKQELPAAVRALIRPPAAEAFSLKPFSRRTLKVGPTVVMP